MTIARSMAWLLAAGVALGCTKTPTPFARSLTQADRIYAQGRYDEAALRYQGALRLAESTHDRDEALYRRAESMKRAGRTAEATQAFTELIARSPRGERAPRAAYERATIALDQGDTARGNAELDALMRSYPDSAASVIALKRRVRGLGESGEGAVQRTLEGFVPELDGTELGQHLHYETAASLEREGRLQQARARYLLVAQRYPYPGGVFWDDSLWHAAELDLRLGEPRAAIRHLEAILAEREEAFLVGSYEKGRYSPAQLRIAEIYRDILHDRAAARRAYEALWTSHATSVLRDEGAWHAATLATEAGDTRGACRLLESLMQRSPDSRYVACIPRLCPTLHPKRSDCHEYILRAREPWTPQRE